MGTNVFISSTITDLGYLRSMVRQHILNIGFTPIMSEHAEVLYEPSTTATQSCYDTIKTTSIVILIIGHRYGNVDNDGISIVHHEYNAAIKANVPIFTLIDRDVMAKKSVFDEAGEMSSSLTCSSIDYPEKLFSLIDSIRSADANNGFQTFNDAEDAVYKLKSQLALYFSKCISLRHDPIDSRLKDVLSEVRVIRSQLSHRNDQGQEEHKQDSRGLRSIYRKLLEDRFSQLLWVINQMSSVSAFDPFEAIIKANDIEVLAKESGLEFHKKTHLANSLVDGLKRDKYQLTSKDVVAGSTIIDATDPTHRKRGFITITKSALYADDEGERILNALIYNLRNPNSSQPIVTEHEHTFTRNYRVGNLPLY